MIAHVPGNYSADNVFVVHFLNSLVLRIGFGSGGFKNSIEIAVKFDFKRNNREEDRVFFFPVP
jgi:hypothetical protein